MHIKRACDRSAELFECMSYPLRRARASRASPAPGSDSSSRKAASFSDGDATLCASRAGGQSEVQRECSVWVWLCRIKIGADGSREEPTVRTSYGLPVRRRCATWAACRDRHRCGHANGWGVHLIGELVCMRR